MTQASGEASCHATPEVIRNVDAQTVMGASTAFETGVFHVQHLNPEGEVLFECTVKNGTTKELAQNIWNVIRPDADVSVGDATNQLGAADRLTKIGLFRYNTGGTAGACTFSTDDTYGGISGGTNTFTGGDGGNSRTFATIYTAQNWLASTDTPGTGDACTLSNAAPVGFTGTATSNVAGAFVYVCDSTDAGTAAKGCLVAVANFSGLIASVGSSDTIYVTFTGTLTVNNS